MDSHHSSYVFKQAYKKGIPIDGLARYAHDIWTQIETNRDLDLPSQQELLAQYRCDELAALSWDHYSVELNNLSHQVDEKIVETLGTQLDGFMKSALLPFDQQGSRYLPAVFKKKRADLLSRMFAASHVVYLSQLRKAQRRAVDLLKNTMEVRTLCVSC
jgi:hypothetical protein